jgi:hypothetical protein
VAFGATRYDGIATLARLGEILPAKSKLAESLAQQATKFEFVFAAALSGGRPDVEQTSPNDTV